MIDQNKIVELTKLAENGDSDKLTNAFAQIPLEDHLSAARAIADQSKIDHKGNPNLPVVELTEVTDPKAGQVVQKIEAVGSRSLFHPSSWISGESRTLVYTEPQPSAIAGAIETIENLNPFKKISDALEKATHGGDQK
jgi:hypothetical protein